MPSVLSSLKGNLHSVGNKVSSRLSSAKARILPAKKKPPINGIKKTEPKTNFLGKGKILGEGINGKVTALSPFTVRKEYKPKKMEVVRKLLDGKTAPQREWDVQKVLASRGVAPQLRAKGIRHIDMERVYGRTLDSKLKHGKASAGIQKNYGKKLAKQLGKVHDAGVSHNDLHGENSIVGPLGGLKVIDYGWAQSKGRPLKIRERRKDYKRVLKTHRGKEYDAFRQGFKSGYIN